ncbi:MAG: hypothetical protein RIF37_15400, partial [Rhodospirillaceae bacterium]
QRSETAQRHRQQAADCSAIPLRGNHATLSITPGKSPAGWSNFGERFNLKTTLLWGYDDPLFPATDVGVGNDGGFRVLGLKRSHWRTAEPIRRIFRAAFECAGLSYYRPHSFRDMLVLYGEQVCKTPEEFKAWSQNLGHEHVLTTFMSYGNVPTHRQGEVIRGLQTQ